jgi:peptidoglycan/xylan/chitin deacetylase (PgdA/CDA1 family)
MSARPAPVTWPGGVISFTFDDFPESALAAGGDILEGYGARGTNYASLKSPRSDRLRPGFHEDIRAAHRAGHEIACHTYTHPDLRRMTRRMILVYCLMQSFTIDLDLLCCVDVGKQHSTGDNGCGQS